jgi:hypothetical protein
MDEVVLHVDREDRAPSGIQNLLNRLADKPTVDPFHVSNATEGVIAGQGKT